MSLYESLMRGKLCRSARTNESAIMLPVRFQSRLENAPELTNVKRFITSIVNWCLAAIGNVRRFFSLFHFGIPEGLISLTSWSTLIILGTWYPSTSALKYFFEGNPLPKGLHEPTTAIGEWLMFFTAVISWTWTNLALLCISSSYLGIAARPDIRSTDPRAWGQVLPRSFIIFLGFLLQELALGGGLVPRESQLANGETQQHYLRLAVLSSILCFAAAYRSEFFDGFIEKLFGRIDVNEKRRFDPNEFRNSTARDEVMASVTSSQETAPTRPK